MTSCSPSQSLKALKGKNGQRLLAEPLEVVAGVSELKCDTLDPSTPVLLKKKSSFRRIVDATTDVSIQSTPIGLKKKVSVRIAMEPEPVIVQNRAPQEVTIDDDDYDRSFSSDSHEDSDGDSFDELLSSSSNSDEMCSRSSILYASEQYGERRLTGNSEFFQENRLGIRKFSTAMSKSNFSLADHRKHGGYVYDTVFQKSVGLSFLLLGCILNILLMFTGYIMSKGVVLAIPQSVLRLSLGMILELTVLILNSYTLSCLSYGVSIYLATLLTSEEGYALVACGFMQANSIGRLTFAYNLPKTCTYRKQLLTLSLLWVAVEFVKVRAPITATGFTDSLISTLESPIGCIVYKPKLEYMRDRTYPTMESTAGVSELLFGDALGCVRSNSNCVGNKTQFVHGPQLMGAVGDGDTIIGLGFYMNISSSCACVQPMNVPTPLLSQNQSLIKLSDLAVYPLDYVIQDHHISSTAIILSPRYCNDSKKVPMCVTNITDIMDVEVLSTFSTDGTTASIALVKSQFYQTTENQQIGGTAIHGALSTILRTNESNTIAMSGILKAAFLGSPFSGNATQKVSLEAAMEMLYSILLRAGIQRTFDTDGLSCPRYKIQKDRTMVFLNSTGSLAIFFVASLQLVLCIFSLVLGSYWIFSTTPLSPAIRVIREPKHFLASLAASPFAANLQGTGNAPASEIWSRLDVVARIGESIHTVDFEVGEILLSRPEEVIPLANDRKYR